MANLFSAKAVDVPRCQRNCSGCSANSDSPTLGGNLAERLFATGKTTVFHNAHFCGSELGGCAASCGFGVPCDSRRVKTSQLPPGIGTPLISANLLSIEQIMDSTWPFWTSSADTPLDCL